MIHITKIIQQVKEKSDFDIVSSEWIGIDDEINHFEIKALKGSRWALLKLYPEDIQKVDDLDEISNQVLKELRRIFEDLH